MGVNPPTGHWSGFSQAFVQGQARILVLRLTRGIKANQPRTWGRWFALSAVPLFSGAVGSLVGLARSPHLDAQNWPLLTLLSTVVAGALAAANLAWNFATERAGTVDELLSTCSVRDRAIQPILTGLKVRWQLLLPLSFWLIDITTVLIDSQHTFSTSALVVGMSLLWALFIVGNDVWWLLVPPLVVWRLRSSTDLNLREYDPARTPGIRTFAEGYGISSFFLIAGAVAIVLPHTPWDWILGQRWKDVVWATLSILSLWIGVMTQLVLYRLVRGARLRLLDAVHVELSLLFPRRRFWFTVRSNPSLLSSELSIYSTVGAFSNLPYGSSVIATYFSAVAGSILGFLLQSR